MQCSNPTRWTDIITFKIVVKSNQIRDINSVRQKQNTKLTSGLYFQITLLEPFSYQKHKKNPGEKGAVCFVDDPQLWRDHLVSGVRRLTRSYMSALARSKGVKESASYDSHSRLPNFLLRKISQKCKSLIRLTYIFIVNIVLRNNINHNISIQCNVMLLHELLIFPSRPGFSRLQRTS